MRKPPVMRIFDNYHTTHQEYRYDKYDKKLMDGFMYLDGSYYCYGLTIGWFIHWIGNHWFIHEYKY